jgi:hypothetical protein
LWYKLFNPQVSSLMMDRTKVINWIKRLGFWGFLFFLVKGLLWLLVPALLALWATNWTSKGLGLASPEDLSRKGAKAQRKLFRNAAALCAFARESLLGKNTRTAELW